MTLGALSGTAAIASAINRIPSGKSILFVGFER
jgi:hypothetical protein